MMILNPYIVAPSDPASIAGLILRLEADLVAGANGSAVSSWPDSSGNGHHATQATAGNRPTIQRAALNGRDCVRFNGSFSNYVDNSSLLLNLSSRTVFLVLKQTGAATGSGYFSIKPAGANSDGNRNDAVSFNSGSTLAIHMAVDGGSGSTYHTQIAGTQPAPLAIYSEVCGSGVGTLYKDGVSISSDAAGPSWAMSGGGYIIGRRWTTGAAAAASFWGDVGEILVYNSALSPSDRSAVESYLSAKYSI